MSGRQRALAEWLMKATGDERCGNDCPPGGGHSVLYVKEEFDGLTRIVSSLNDGHEIGFGYPDDWQVIMRVHTARLFALWILKEWVRRWFGLRDAVYFRALHFKVSGSWKRLGKPHRRMARPSSHDEWYENRVVS